MPCGFALGSALVLQQISAVSKLKESALGDIRERRSEMFSKLCFSLPICLCAIMRLDSHTKTDLRHKNNIFNEAPCVVSS